MAALNGRRRTFVNGAQFRHVEAAALRPAKENAGTMSQDHHPWALR
jgi:hypothetical protein